MINHILYYPENQNSERDKALTLLRTKGIEPRVAELNPEDESRNEILLQTSVGEFEGLEGIDFYLSFDNLQRLQERARFNTFTNQHLASFNRYEFTQRKTPAYKGIVDMGNPAVPFILERLVENPHAWFLILGEIIKKPIPKSIQGNVSEMVKYFQELGKTSDYSSN